MLQELQRRPSLQKVSAFSRLELLDDLEARTNRIPGRRKGRVASAIPFALRDATTGFTRRFAEFTPNIGISLKAKSFEKAKGLGCRHTQGPCNHQPGQLGQRREQCAGAS
jgi:hypothetical protein